MLIDTHAHLDFPEFAADLTEILARARDAGVERVITIGTSIEGSKRALELANRFPNVFATIGVHPNEAVEAGNDVVGSLRELARNPRVVALGEIGLDYHRLPQRNADTAWELAGDQGSISAGLQMGAVKAAQATIFEQQLDLAIELGLNVVIHERDAWSDTIEILAPYAGKLRAVFHCFGKSIEQAEEVVAQGHLVSFTGIVTFKNATVVQETAARVADDAFMVETDCPFLAPAPLRGKRCEPAHTRITAEKIAQLRNVPLETVSAQTTRTASRFFRFTR